MPRKLLRLAVAIMLGFVVAGALATFIVGALAGFGLPVPAVVAGFGGPIVGLFGAAWMAKEVME